MTFYLGNSFGVYSLETEGRPWGDNREQRDSIVKSRRSSDSI